MAEWVSRSHHSPKDSLDVARTSLAHLDNCSMITRRIHRETFKFVDCAEPHFDTAIAELLNGSTKSISYLTLLRDRDLLSRRLK
ncbi:MAG: hypothetical protein WAL99_15090 [Pseudonocardiaceae bacterium]